MPSSSVNFRIDGNVMRRERQVRRLCSTCRASAHDPNLWGAGCCCFHRFTKSFGLPVVEAMALGTPAVTSNVSSLPEAIGARLLD